MEPCYPGVAFATPCHPMATGLPDREGSGEGYSVALEGFSVPFLGTSIAFPRDP